MMKPFYQTKPPQEGVPELKYPMARLWSRVFLFLLGALLITSYAWAQNQTVSGTVTSADKSALPGVSVIVKGTSNGTSTDADGKFTVSVSDPQNSILVFSFIGYATQEVQVNNRTEINLDLEEDITQLNEVVVTALGISQQKKSLGYATQEVKGTEISKAQRPNFFVALQGRVAGLTMTTTSGMPTTPSISQSHRSPCQTHEARQCRQCRQAR